MKFEERSEGAAVVLSLAGRLDAVGARDLEARIAAVAKTGRLVLDCGGVDYLSSAGLRALLLGAKTCLQTGCEFSVAALTPECRSIMDAAGLLKVLDCPGTVEAALAPPPPPPPKYLPDRSRCANPAGAGGGARVRRRGTAAGKPERAGPDGGRS